MRSFCLLSVLLVALLSGGLARQADSSKSRTEKTKSEQARTAEKKTPETTPASEETKPETEKAAPADKEKEEHYDVTEVPPVVTHHQVTVEGWAGCKQAPIDLRIQRRAWIGVDLVTHGRAGSETSRSAT